jgi:hypothetical protein
MNVFSEFFEVGQVYEDRYGTYEVVSVEPSADRMTIRRADGEEVTVSDLVTRQRIAENVARERATAQPPTQERVTQRPSAAGCGVGGGGRNVSRGAMLPHGNSEHYWYSLGYLTATAYIAADVPVMYQGRFARAYDRLTGERVTPEMAGYCLQENLSEHKWSYDTRVTFRARSEDIPRLRLGDNLQMRVVYGDSHYAIARNAFTRLLFASGFRLGRQNPSLILEHVPVEYRGAFLRGLRDAPRHTPHAEQPNRAGKRLRTAQAG